MALQNINSLLLQRPYRYQCVCIIVGHYLETLCPLLKGKPWTHLLRQRRVRPSHRQTTGCCTICSRSPATGHLRGDGHSNPRSQCHSGCLTSSLCRWQQRRPPPSSTLPQASPCSHHGNQSIWSGPCKIRGRSLITGREGVQNGESTSVGSKCFAPKTGFNLLRFSPPLKCEGNSPSPTHFDYLFFSVFLCFALRNIFIFHYTLFFLVHPTFLGRYNELRHGIVIA